VHCSKFTPWILANKQTSRLDCKLGLTSRRRKLQSQHEVANKKPSQVANKSQHKLQTRANTSSKDFSNDEAFPNQSAGNIPHPTCDITIVTRRLSGSQNTKNKLKNWSKLDCKKALLKRSGPKPILKASLDNKSSEGKPYKRSNSVCKTACKRTKV
jgi:hypothetical protein